MGCFRWWKGKPWKTPQARKDLVVRRTPTVKLKMNIECPGMMKFFFGGALRIRNNPWNVSIYIYIYYTLFFFEDQQLKSLRKQRFIHPKPLEGPWGFLKWNLCTWQVVVTFLGWWSDPLNGQVSSNSGDEKVTNWITWCRLLCYFVFVLVFVVFLNMSGGRLIAFA